MATFKFVGREIDIHWNGYDIVGPAETVFSIPDQLYEEFEGDIRGVEPSLTWIDTNEFLTLTNTVSTSTLSASLPIAITTTTSGKNISLSSATALNGYLLAANGTGGTIWTPASTSSLTSVIGVSPISTVISGGTVSVSLSANYQTAGSYQPSGTYVTTVGGSSPISTSGTTAITVSIDSSILTAENAARMRTYVRNATASTIAKGSVVYLDGSNGTVPSIQKALANADATSARTFGIVEEDIATNSNGYVTNQGLLSPLNTSGVADGAVLWLSPTVAGAFTTTKPSGPDHGVLVGIVVKGTSVGAGSVYVLIKNGAELDEIHDVNISSLASGQALIYSSTASVWQNSLIGSTSISASAVTSGHILAGAVGSAALAAGSVTDAKISANSVTSGHILAGAVGTSALANGAVTSIKIAAGAVDSAALGTGAVTSAKIGTSAVTSGHISAASVGTVAISSGAATSGQILQANGSGGASFATITSGAQVYTTTLTGTGTWTVPTGLKKIELLVIGGGGGGGGGALAACISAPSAGSGAGGGGGGGSASGVYFPNYEIEPGVTSVSYSVATGGSGGAAISYTAATGTVKSETFTTGNAGSSASGATTFGSVISMAAANGGTGGTASKTGNPLGGTGGGYGNATSLSQYSYHDTLQVSSYIVAADGGATGTGSDANGNSNVSIAAISFAGKASRFYLAAVAGLKIGYSAETSHATTIPSSSRSGTGTLNSSFGTTTLATAVSLFAVGNAGGGGGAQMLLSGTAGKGGQGVNQAGNGGAGISLGYATSTLGTITAAAQAGYNAIASTGNGGGGGGSLAIHVTSSANSTPTGYALTSGKGGDGAAGIIIIRGIY